MSLTHRDCCTLAYRELSAPWANELLTQALATMAEELGQAGFWMGDEAVNDATGRGAYLMRQGNGWVGELSSDEPAILMVGARMGVAIDAGAPCRVQCNLELRAWRAGQALADEPFLCKAVFQRQLDFNATQDSGVTWWLRQALADGRGSGREKLQDGAKLFCLQLVAEVTP